MQFLITILVFTTITNIMAEESSPTSTSSSLEHTEYQINDMLYVIANISRLLNPSIVDFCAEGFTAKKKIVKNYQRDYMSIAECERVAISPSKILNHKIYRRAQQLRSECLFCHIKVLYVNDSTIDRSRNFANQEYWNSQGTYFYLLLTSAFTPQKPLIGPPRTTYWMEAIYNETERSFKIYEIYCLSSSPEPLLQYAAQWSLEKGIVLQKNWSMGMGPRNFQGKSIHIATLDHTAPYVSKAHLCSHNSRTNDCIKVLSKYQIRPENTTGYYHGFLIKLFDDLAEIQNFTYIVDNYGEEYFDLKTADGYDGLANLLWTRKVDLLVSSIFMSEFRFTYMGFTHLIESTYKAMFYDYKAVKFAGRWDIYTDSFSNETWLAIFASILLYSLVHWAMKNYNPRNRDLHVFVKLKDSEESLDENYTSISDIFMTYFSCIVQQGLSDTPASTYLRIPFWIFWITSVTLYASYSGILTSYLTLDTQIPLFGTLKEAIESNEYEVGMLKGSLGQIQVSYSRRPWHQQLSKDLIQKPDLLSDDFTEAYHRIQKEKYVFYDDVSTMSFLYTNCSLRKIPDKDFRSYGYFARPKYLPYSRLLDYILLETFTSGIQEHHAIRLLRDQQICEKPSGYNEMEIYHIFPACIVFSLGLGLSVLFLMIETAAYTRLSRIDKNSYANGSQAWKFMLK